MRRSLSVFLLTSLVVVPAKAWWETGHEVVARIAASRLTPAAQTRVARIIGVADTREAVADALAAASIWADQVKGQTGTGDWHYIDLTIQDHRDDEQKRCPEQNCLPDRITSFEALLKEPAPHADSKWTEADALKFLVHFVGDSTQPLHAAEDADAGGNCEQIDPPFERAKNLHALWDGGIIAAMNESEKKLAADLEREIQRMPHRQVRRLAKGEVMDWIWDSHELALHDIYYKLHVPIEEPVLPKSCGDAPAEIQNFKLQVDPAYVDAMKPVVRLQLIKGGLRLALVLNEIL